MAQARASGPGEARIPLSSGLRPLDTSDVREALWTRIVVHNHGYLPCGETAYRWEVQFWPAIRLIAALVRFRIALVWSSRSGMWRQVDVGATRRPNSH